MIRKKEPKYTYDKKDMLVQINQELPPIIEVPDVESATKIWKTGKYCAPRYEHGYYHFIMKSKVFNELYGEKK